MKKILFLLFFISSFTNSKPVDSTVFQYYPMNVGNRWTWYIFQNNSPGPGYKTAIIQGTAVYRNHLYYKFKNDTYIFYGNQHYTSYSYNRIDSLSGNLYDFYINDSTECLIDSLNSVTGDSTYHICGGPNGQWYRYFSDSMNFFNQTFNTKSYLWSNYFEGGDAHAYAKGLGYVKYEYAAHTAVYNVTIKGCLINGVLYGDTTVYLGINHLSTEIPNNFSLSQNYPNPFNPTTKIKFDIPSSVETSRWDVLIAIYDALGKEVAVLVNQQLQPGSYETDWDASAFPSGVYYYKLEVIDLSTPHRVTETKKMVLIK